MSLGVASTFPAEVEPCISKLSTGTAPLFGVRCTEVIPQGTWVGPFEGAIVAPENMHQVIVMICIF